MCRNDFGKILMLCAALASFQFSCSSGKYPPVKYPQVSREKIALSSNLEPKVYTRSDTLQIHAIIHNLDSSEVPFSSVGGFVYVPNHCGHVVGELTCFPLKTALTMTVR